MANQIMPPPLDNDPEPQSQKAADAQRAWIGDPTWQAFKSWIGQLYKILRGIKADTSGAVSINGLPIWDTDIPPSGAYEFKGTAPLPVWDVDIPVRGVLEFLPSPSKGQLLNTVVFTDAGSSTTSTVPVNIQAIAFNYTPVSKNSYLNIVWYFEGLSNILAATNTEAFFRGYEVTSGNVALGTITGIEVANGSGGNSIITTCSVSVVGLANTVTTTRIFELFAWTSNAGSPAQATGISCIIQEISN